MASSNITLSAGVRQNLLSLQNTAQLMSQTQNRLATGKKVNSALDNATNFFTAQSLQSRAADLSSLLDNMTSGIKTLEAADNGLSAITKTVESMQSTLRQARQDKSFKTESYTLGVTTPDGTEEISFTGGSVGTTPVDIQVTNTLATLTGDTYAALDFNNNNAFGPSITFDIAANGGTARTIEIEATDDTTLSVTVDGGTATTTTVADADAVTGAEIRDALNAAFDAATTPVAITASFAAGALTFTSDVASYTGGATNVVTVTNITDSGGVADSADLGFDSGTTAGIAATGAEQATVDAIVQAINANDDLENKVRATNDNGRLRIENLSTEELEVDGVTAAGVVDGTSSGGAAVDGNTVRVNLVKQFNELRDQLDKLADDASYNGVNLLRGDLLKLTFNETGTSTIEIQAKDEDGEARAINSGTLDISTALNADFDTDAGIDSLLTELSDALGVLRTQSSSFGSNLSIVENRTEFSKAMINTLQTGADNLVLADTNEEAANMLALQTRQQLSSTALSLASQADQAVLRLF